jgi:hypothetical protein
MATLFPTFKALPPNLKVPLWNPTTGSQGDYWSQRIGAAAMALPSIGPAGIASTPSAGPAFDFSSILNTLLSGLGGSGPQGLKPEEGIAQAKRALIQYGEIPGTITGSGLKNLKPAFDEGTRKLAAANTASGISVKARLNEADLDQRRYIRNRLAAHGILESGETGFQSGRAQTGFARALADSTGKLLVYLSGIYAGIAQYLEYQAQQDAIRKMLANLMRGPSGPSGPSEPSGPSPTPPAAPSAAPLMLGPGTGVPDAQGLIRLTPPNKRIAW